LDLAIRFSPKPQRNLDDDSHVLLDPLAEKFVASNGIILNCRASLWKRGRFVREPLSSLNRLTVSHLRQPASQIEARKPAMSALWINTKEQRSEGSFAGYPVNSLPAHPLRC
jgi:hypothetical protein